MRRIHTLAIAILLTVTIWAQAPQKMSYQAVIRNSSNVLITSSPVGMQISILQGSASGTVVYIETQTPSTNANGLVSLEIGNGTVITGTFTAINWANGPYFIKTETDPTGGTAYTISGTNELMSVPYALHAKTAEGITGGITETDPVFLASPANGITSASITSWNNKLDTEVDGSITNEIQALSISNDTIYLSNGGYVKLPAGFDGNYNNLTNAPTNVSSFTNDAGYLTSFTEVDGSLTNELQALSISNDTIYLSNGGYVKIPSANAWGLNGNAGTIAGTNFIGTTDNVPLNFKVNNEPSGRIEPSMYSTFFGYQSGKSNTSGIFNTAVGEGSLLNNTSGDYNTAFGAYSLYNNATGSHNTAIGKATLLSNTTGHENTSIGLQSMYNNTTGYLNTAVGYDALLQNTTGNNNVALGVQSGRNNLIGSDNVFLGYQAGYNETGSNKLYIANNSGMPLIYGDFATSKIGLGTMTPTYKLEVTEDVSFNGVRVGRGNGNITTNTSIGFNTLNSNTTGANNIAVGYKSLFLNTSGGQNTAIGDNALAHNTTATGNTSIGYATLAENTTGNFNSALGYDALLYNTTGEQNTALGSWSMHFNTIGKWNTSLGFSALQKNISGNNNTVIGHEAGLNNTTGSNNVFIGYRAGYNEMGSNKLYVANSNTTTPLIYGDFATSKIGIGTITPSKELTIKGDAQIQTKGAWTPGSKARLYLGEDDNIWIEHIHSIGLNLNTASGWKMTFMDGTDENMRIDGSGNVGIGTTSPTAKLEVNGSIKVTGGTASQFLKADGSLDANTYLSSFTEVDGSLTNELQTLSISNDTIYLSNGGFAKLPTTSTTTTNITAGTNIIVTGNGTTVAPYNISVSKSKFYLGQDTLGGIVYYIYIGSDGNQHGLIVSKTETSSAIWGGATSVGADRTEDGVYNMNLMPIGGGTARTWAESFGAGWYLPSIDELNFLWHNRYHVNKTARANSLTLLSTSTNYWSSTEWNSSSSLVIMFNGGSSGFSNKANTYSVRAIRSF